MSTVKKRLLEHDEDTILGFTHKLKFSPSIKTIFTDIWFIKMRLLIENLAKHSNIYVYFLIIETNYFP